VKNVRCLGVCFAVGTTGVEPFPVLVLVLVLVVAICGAETDLVSCDSLRICDACREYLLGVLGLAETQVGW
jgi:hypothetical protein